MLLAHLQDKGLLAVIRVHKQNNQTKVETVFDWDAPEYAELLEQARKLKTDKKR